MADNQPDSLDECRKYKHMNFACYNCTNNTNYYYYTSSDNNNNNIDSAYCLFCFIIIVKIVKK